MNLCSFCLCTTLKKVTYDFHLQKIEYDCRNSRQTSFCVCKGVQFLWLSRHHPLHGGLKINKNIGIKRNTYAKINVSCPSPN